MFQIYVYELFAPSHHRRMLTCSVHYRTLNNEQVFDVFSAFLASINDQGTTISGGSLILIKAKGVIRGHLWSMQENLWVYCWEWSNNMASSKLFLPRLRAYQQRVIHANHSITFTRPPFSFNSIFVQFPLRNFLCFHVFDKSW